AEHCVDESAGLAPTLSQSHAARHRQAMSKRTGGRGDARIAVIRMHTEPAVWRAIRVQIIATQYALFLEDHVLDHASVPFRHQKGVRRVAARTLTHEAVVDHIDHFRAR